MAIYRLSAQVIGRKDGRSAVAAAAYRAGGALRDERAGQVHDYRRKRDVARAQVLAPADAPDWMRERERLWNAVEAAERRRDAQLAREVQLALPRELDAEAQWRLAVGFVRRAFVGRGMVADVAHHRARTREGGEAQDHVHVMLTMRALTAGGFGKKAGHWNATELLRAWRADWAAAVNEALAAAGSGARVDHRTLAAQRGQANREAAVSRGAGDEAGARAAELRMVALDRAPEPKRGVRSDVVDGKGREKGERQGAWKAVRASNARRRAALTAQLEARWELADAWAERAAERAEERRQDALAARAERAQELGLRRAALDGVGARLAAAGRELGRRRDERVRELDAALVAADDEAERSGEERAKPAAERRAAEIEEGWAAHHSQAGDGDGLLAGAAAGLVARIGRGRSRPGRGEAAVSRETQEAVAWAIHGGDHRARSDRVAARAAEGERAFEAWDERAEAAQRDPRPTVVPEAERAEDRRSAALEARVAARQAERVDRSRERARRDAEEVAKRREARERGKVEARIARSRARVLRARGLRATATGVVRHLRKGRAMLEPFTQDRLGRATRTLLARAGELLAAWQAFREGRRGDDFHEVERGFTEASTDLHEMHMVLAPARRLTGAELAHERDRMAELEAFPDQDLIRPAIGAARGRAAEIERHLRVPEGAGKMAEHRSAQDREAEQRRAEQEAQEGREAEDERREAARTARRVEQVDALVQRAGLDPQVRDIVARWIDLDRPREAVLHDPLWPRPTDDGRPVLGRVADEIEDLERRRERERIEAEQARARVVLAARDEGLAPPAWDEFHRRCASDRHKEVADAFMAVHEPWWEWMADRLERERPAIMPPSLDPREARAFPGRARALMLATATDTLLRTPEWRAHASRAASMSATMWPAERRPAFERFRTVVEGLRARPADEARPPEPRAEPRPGARRVVQGPEDEPRGPRGP